MPRLKQPLDALGKPVEPDKVYVALAALATGSSIINAGDTYTGSNPIVAACPDNFVLVTEPTDVVRPMLQQRALGANLVTAERNRQTQAILEQEQQTQRDAKRQRAEAEEKRLLARWERRNRSGRGIPKSAKKLLAARNLPLIHGDYDDLEHGTINAERTVDR